jgi:hypothetical protein
MNSHISTEHVCLEAANSDHPLSLHVWFHVCSCNHVMAFSLPCKEGAGGEDSVRHQNTEAATMESPHGVSDESQLSVKRTKL